MYKINVKVESNKVSIISETVPITTNSLNTIKCVFDLPQEYENLSCVAVFTCIDKVYKQMIVDNECMILKDILKFGGYVKIGVYAFKGEDLMYSPEPTGFKVTIGSYTEEESEEEAEKTQTAFDKMIEKTNELFLKIEQANEDLDNKIAEIEEKIEVGGGNGADGFSPTITEKINDGDTYILEITNKDGNFDTPNLKGKDGLNGVDGIDGKNGADGKDGTNGVDGQDGFSPIITVKTDTYEEYILEIIDKNGTYETSNLIGKNGKDGINGYTPEKGVDYFTAEEITEITNTITNTVNNNLGLILDEINGEVI